MKEENRLAREVARRISHLMQAPLTSRFCIREDGKFSNKLFEATSVKPQSVRVPDGWAVGFEFLALEPITAVGQRAVHIMLDEESLLPWNISASLLWPKYPHLFSAFTVPDSDWLEVCEVAPYAESTIEYPVRAKAVKLHKGITVMPVGVMLNSNGEHCYMLAVEKGSSAFDTFQPTVLFPIGSFNTQAIPLDNFDVAGW